MKGIYIVLDKIGIKPSHKKYVSHLKLKGNEDILEFGCEDDRLTKEILKQLDSGGNLICVDLSDESLMGIRKLIKKYDNVSCVIGDIRKIKMENTFYNRIIMNTIFFDLPAKERNSYIKYLISKLKSKGRLHIREVINRNDISSSAKIRQTMREIGLKEKDYAFIKEKGDTVYTGTYGR